MLSSASSTSLSILCEIVAGADAALSDASDSELFLSSLSRDAPADSLSRDKLGVFTFSALSPSSVLTALRAEEAVAPPDDPTPSSDDILR